MTFTQFINAFPPGNIIPQVSENGSSISNFEPIQETEPMSKNDIARKTADLSDRLLQRKVGLS